MIREDIKQQARELRIKGYSFREISQRFGIAESTVGLWCRKEVVTPTGLKRLKELEDAGRLRGQETLKRKRIAVLSEIDKNCGVLVNKNYDVDDYKLFLGLLYWGEGDKTSNRFGFSNSDQDMIKICLYLLRKSFNIEENRLRVLLHLHNYHNPEEMLDYWSKITAIPKNNFSIYNKPHTGISKKPGYKGCLSIRYGDSRILQELFIIIERFKNIDKIAGLV